jgi:hypothetical protein
MNPDRGRPSQKTLAGSSGRYRSPTSPKPGLPQLEERVAAHVRIAGFERQRRQELLTPAALAMILLALSGFLPATRPTLVPALIGGLGAVIVALSLAIILNRANLVRTAIALFILTLIGFYAVALFLTPATPNGQLAVTDFTAGSTYYFLAGVLPVFAAPLLSEMPWPALVYLVIFGMDMACIWALPHDATFDAFAGHLGGPIFLTASITIGQVVLIVFGTAAASSIRRSLGAANRASDLEEINRNIAARQRALEADIYALQQTQAQIANGEQAHANLPPTSELYPLAASLNLMVDRLARLAQAGAELRQIEIGLSEASNVIARMAQGELSVRPQPTGTIVDGLLASLVQVQGQVAAWVNSIARALADVQTTHEQTLESARDMVQAIAQVRELASRLPPPENADGMELAALAQQNAERLLQLLQAVERRERAIAAAVARIRTTSSRG